MGYLLNFLCARPPLTPSKMALATDGDISSLETDLEGMPKLEITTDKVTVITKEVKTLKPGVPTVMIAGRPKSGKSTDLNNLFNLNLAATTSASSVTSALSITEVIKNIPMKTGDSSSREVTMQVIDTPGLGALDISKQEVLDEMKRITKGVNFTLLYCFSVSPSNSLLEIDKTIITNLQHAFGREVWKRCLLLFTFSDHAHLELEDPAEYVRHINAHAQKFDELLQDISGNTSRVKSIFEYESPNALSEEETPSSIIAIPIKKKVDQSQDILPGMIESWQDWTDVVFIELMKRTNSTQREPFLLFKYAHIVTSLIFLAEGVAVGAGFGGAIGLAGGPVGMGIGVIVGAIAGGAIAGGAVAGVAAAVETPESNIKNTVKKISFIKKR